MNRQSWTLKEDQAIRTLVQQFGVMDWTKISQKLKEQYQISQRTGKQCRERWYNHLNPEVNKKPWTHQEQTHLFQIHRKSGNRWKLMSGYFQGRTDNDIKNHFYSTLRRSLRRLNKFIGEKNSTTQMRQIKPSVLSTIMNYIYEQDQCIESNIVNSLKDLPYLIFEFSNYKPIKNKSKVDDLEIKTKINFIFELINNFNTSYQQLKQSRNQKGKKHKSQKLVNQKQLNEGFVQKHDFIKYLPKKSSNTFSNSGEQDLKMFQLGQHKESKKKQQIKPRLVKLQREVQLLQTDFMQNGVNDRLDSVMRRSDENQFYTFQDMKKDDHANESEGLPMLSGLGGRRISLQQKQQFIDQSIGQLQQPSIFGLCMNDGLMIVGRQMMIHTNDNIENQRQRDIDEYIAMQYHR